MPGNQNFQGMINSLLFFLLLAKDTNEIRQHMIYGEMLLLWSHSPNEVSPEPQWNVSIAAVRGAVHLSSFFMEK